MEPSSILVLLALMRTMSAQNVVRVEQGELRGQEVTTVRGNKTYMAYKGIPYAKPPLGDLRFKDPEPPSSWTGIRDALEFGNECSQMANGSVIGHEDCLFLNVYSPELTMCKPVMVWIHGGGFTSGSSNNYGPDYFILDDVVVVTINYRLGAMGYMSLLTTELPGNAGSKDQVLALKWVQKNIVKFGGDPNNVTIFGESSGGASVHSHLLSPMSKGLFHQAISLSGTMLCSWALTSTPVVRARRLGTAVGCTQNNLNNLTECLRDVSAQNITAATDKANGPEDIKYLNVLAFTPVVDGGVTGVDVFLPEKPYNLINKGQFNKVPYIAGVSSAEIWVYLSFVPDFEAILTNITDNLELLIPTDMGIIGKSLEAINISKKIEEFYYGTTTILGTAISPLIGLLSDVSFIYPTWKTLNLQSSSMLESQYMYYFDFQGELNLGAKTMTSSFRNLKGAVHSDVLNYMFHMDNTNLDVTLPADSPEMKTLFRMVRMCTNFGNSGNPTPVRDPLLMNVSWSRYTELTEPYLHIWDNLTIEWDLRKKQMEFWDALYTLYRL